MGINFYRSRYFSSAQGHPPLLVSGPVDHKAKSVKYSTMASDVQGPYMLPSVGHQQLVVIRQHVGQEFLEHHHGPGLLLTAPWSEDPPKV